MPGLTSGWPMVPRKMGSNFLNSSIVDRQPRSQDRGRRERWPLHRYTRQHDRHDLRRQVAVAQLTPARARRVLGGSAHQGRVRKSALMNIHR